MILHIDPRSRPLAHPSEIQLSDGSCFKIWDQVQAEGRVMLWLLTGLGSLCSEENHQQAHSQMNLRKFTFSTQVCASFGHFLWAASKFENAEHIKYPKPDLNSVKPGDKGQPMRRPSTGPSTDQSQQPTASSGSNAARTVSPYQPAPDPEELRRAVSPQNMRAQRPSPSALPSQPAPAGMNGKPRRGPGGDDDGEGSTDSVIRERALSPDQARARNPPSRGGTPTGPVSIESVVKTAQNQRSESPLVDRERARSPDAQNHGPQQPNVTSVNGFTSARDTQTDSPGNDTAELVRDLKARDAELETLRRREAWMKAALAQASHAGFVYVDVNAGLGDEDRGVTDGQPKIAEAVITLKQLHGRIQVRKLACSCMVTRG